LRSDDDGDVSSNYSLQFSFVGNLLGYPDKTLLPNKIETEQKRTAQRVSDRLVGRRGEAGKGKEGTCATDLYVGISRPKSIEDFCAGIETAALPFVIKPADQWNEMRSE
jgi:hypothetical protein